MSALSFLQAELPANRPGEDLPLVLTPWTPEVFRAPLDFIVAEHGRQLVVCNLMERLRHNPRHGAQRVVFDTPSPRMGSLTDVEMMLTIRPYLACFMPGTNA